MHLTAGGLDMSEKLNYQFLRMFDCYKGLLTDRQRDVMELYYNEDCSLSEIAELRGITRQAVSDSLRHSRQILQETEEKLGLAQRSEALRTCMMKIRDAAGEQENLIRLTEEALELIDG